MLWCTNLPSTNSVRNKIELLAFIGDRNYLYTCSVVILWHFAFDISELKMLAIHQWAFLMKVIYWVRVSGRPSNFKADIKMKVKCNATAAVAVSRHQTQHRIDTFGIANWKLSMLLNVLYQFAFTSSYCQHITHSHNHAHKHHATRTQHKNVSNTKI